MAQPTRYGGDFSLAESVADLAVLAHTDRSDGCG